MQTWRAEYKGDSVIIKFDDREQAIHFWNGFLGTTTAVSETTKRRSFVKVNELKNRQLVHNNHI